MLAQSRRSVDRCERAPARPSTRPGSAAFETLLILPLFLIAIFGAVGLSDLLIAEQRLDEAAGRLARLAACGGSKDQIRSVAVACLGPDRVRNAKIYVGPCRRNGNQSDQGQNQQGQDRDHNSSDPTLRSDDHSDGNRTDQGPGSIVVIPVQPGELVEVRIELAAGVTTVTCLAPIRGGEILLGRAVMQRE
jgi:hypothetical protein